MTLFKVGFFMNQFGRKSEFPDTFSKKSRIELKQKPTGYDVDTRSDKRTD
jgi:hypothetical protein